jgi:Fe-Mn family superoxide dismutase
MSHWNRRQILRSVGAGLATLTLAPLSELAARAAQDVKATAGYTLPKLPYAYDALEPSIDAETMRIHHDKHHQAYITNAINLLKSQPALLALPVDTLLADVSKVPEKIRQGVINNAGGHSNHTIFWEIMGPRGGGEPTGALAKAIDGKFGSFEKFKMGLSQAAVTQFGSGWAWLVMGKTGLEIVQRPNQNSPIMTGLTPLLGIDVWEHAYYLKYRNERPKYVQAFWSVINWKAVADRYGAAAKG